MTSSGNGAAVREFEKLEAPPLAGPSRLDQDLRALSQRMTRERAEQPAMVMVWEGSRLSPGFALEEILAPTGIAFSHLAGGAKSEIFTPAPLSGPLALFRRLVDRWELKTSEACRLLGLDPTDVLRLQSIRLGLAPFVGRDPMDRLDAMTEIFRSLAGRFGRNPKAERDWLRAATTDLKDRAPLTVMTEDGMEGLLTVRDYLRWLDGR